MKFLFVFIFLFFGICPALAAEENPASLQGLWSGPDCAQAGRVWVISKHFFIRSLPGDLTIGAVKEWQQEQSEEDLVYTLLDGNGETYSISRSNDGLMKVSSGAMTDDYSHCAKLFDNPPGLGQAEVNTIFMLDYALQGCGSLAPDSFSGAEACHRILFSLTDSNRDAALDRAELVRLAQQLAFLDAGLNECGAKIFDPAASADRNAALADMILAGTDGTLNLAEIDSLLRQENIRQKLPVEALSGVMPFLPVPGQTSSCHEQGAGAVQPGPLLEEIRESAYP